MKKVVIIAAEEVSRDQRVMKEAEYLAARGYDVEILCWDRENQFIHRSEERVGNFKIVRLFREAKYGSGFRQIVPYIKFIWDARGYLRKKDVHYLHCQNLDGLFTGLFMKIKGDIVFDMREYYEGRVKGRLKKFVIRRLVNFSIKKACYILYVNETQKLNVQPSNWSKLVFLPNYPKASLGDSAHKSYSDRIRISYVGSVRQYTEFINLFKAARGKSAYMITINGSGVRYKELKAQELLYNNVRITGAYDPSETAALLRDTDIMYCVYSSENENWRTAFPIKLFEAIITLTPVIVNKDTVLEDFVRNHGIGFVVDGSDADDIRDLLDMISGNTFLLKKKTENLKKIQFNYCWENVVSNLNLIYDGEVK